IPETRRVSVRFLHAGPDLRGRGYAGRDQGGRAEPRDRGHHSTPGDIRGRVSRAHERQHLPMRRLLQHPGSDRGGRGTEARMKQLTYERATSPAEAAASAARNQGAKFVGGGTNLLDLMKLQIETP